MKLAASAFALLLATGVGAYAQGTGMAPSKSATPTSSDQCWDMATNSVKSSQQKTISQGPSGTSSASGNSAASTNPTTPPGAAGSAATTGAAPTARPAGMPAC